MIAITVLMLVNDIEEEYMNVLFAIWGNVYEVSNKYHLP